jgi:hypothetical protein
LKDDQQTPPISVWTIPDLSVSALLLVQRMPKRLQDVKGWLGEDKKFIGITP